MMAENRCVCCGEHIPEGTQVCPRCMKKYEVTAVEGERARRSMRTEEIMNDWVYPILLCILIVFFIIFVTEL